MGLVFTYEVDARTANSVDVFVRFFGQHSDMSAASAALPSGAYTTFRTYAGKRVLRLGQHAARLGESISLLGQPATVHVAHLHGGVAQALQHARAQSNWPAAAHAPEARFRVTFAPPQLFVSVEPFAPYPHALYETGVRCVTVALHRNNPHAKSTSFIASAAQAYKQLPAGVNEGLMIADDGSGAILEGLSSNFFAVLAQVPAPPLRPHPDKASFAGGGGTVGGVVLRTEAERVLSGVTRALVLEIAQAVLPISSHAVTLPELPAVRECFITSVSREILPVVQVDDIVIGNGRPGPITQMLRQRLAELVQREAVVLTPQPNPFSE
jgi:branched-chain amino acid aminotransferase